MKGNNFPIVQTGMKPNEWAMVCVLCFNLVWELLKLHTHTHTSRGCVGETCSWTKVGATRRRHCRLVKGLGGADRQRERDAVPTLRSTWREPVTRTPQFPSPLKVCVVYAGSFLFFSFFLLAARPHFRSREPNVGRRNRREQQQRPPPKRDNPLSCCLWP